MGGECAGSSGPAAAPSAARQPAPVPTTYPPNERLGRGSDVGRFGRGRSTATRVAGRRSGTGGRRRGDVFVIIAAPSVPVPARACQLLYALALVGGLACAPRPGPPPASASERPPPPAMTVRARPGSDSPALPAAEIEPELPAHSPPTPQLPRRPFYRWIIDRARRPLQAIESVHRSPRRSSPHSVCIHTRLRYGGRRR